MCTKFFFVRFVIWILSKIINIFMIVFEGIVKISKEIEATI